MNKQRNPVAMHCRQFNKAVVQRDRKKSSRLDGSRKRKHKRRWDS